MSTSPLRYHLPQLPNSCDVKRKLNLSLIQEDSNITNLGSDRKDIKRDLKFPILNKGKKISYSDIAKTRSRVRYSCFSYIIRQ